MIILYHKVFPDNPTGWWIKVDEFYRQMLEIQNKKVVYLDNYNPKDPSHVVITFDGVYQNVLKYAAPILKKFGYPFELFIIGDKLGSDNTFDKPEPFAKFADKSELKKLINSGGRLQWHTRSHPNMDLMNEDEKIKKELTVPAFLKKIDPKGFKWFAYPHGEHNPLVVRVVKKYFKGALTCDQGNDSDKYKLNRVIAFNETTFKKATISVIIPCYNYGRFLVEAVESVLAQTRKPDEVLISDDNSSDNSYEIAMSYKRKFPNLIKANRNIKNMGIVKHFAKAVSLCKSDYICFLGADNRFRSDFIEKTTVVLDANEKIGVVYTDFAMFGVRAQLVYENSEKSRKGPVVENFFILKFPDFNNKTKKLLQSKNFIHGSSLYRRKAYQDAGGYKSSSSVAEDHNLFLRMIKSGWDAKRVPEPLLEYRHHSDEQSHAVYGSYSELNFYKHEYKNLALETRQLREEMNRIKSSKFWLMLYLIKNPKEASFKIVSKLKKDGFKAFEKYL